MATLTIGPFRGMLPKVADRVLPEGGAAEATNVDLTSGELVPLRRSSKVFTPSDPSSTVSVYRAEWNEQETWLEWATDVDIVRGPLPPGVEVRFYWTGDGAPQSAKFSDLGSGGHVIGVPAPQTAATVTPTGGSGADVTRVYAYTFYSQDDEEGSWSPASVATTGKIDGTWAIAGMDAFPANSGTGVGVFSSVTTFTNSGNHWLRTGDVVVMGGDRLTVTVAAPNVFTVEGDYSAETAWTRAAPWNTANMKRRLYRSAGTSASYQLVDDDVQTTYSDTKSDAQIMGDEIVSGSWVPPPVGLKGLIVLPNGSLVGFAGNQLCFSEPYQPHAWPVSYRRSADAEIVGIGAYGTTVIAATRGSVFVASGSEPAVVAMDNAGQVWPCLSKRSVISVGDGVMFATNIGMAYIGQSGANIFTQPMFEKRQWEALHPESMRAAVAEGKIYVAYVGDDGAGTLVFSLADAALGLVELAENPKELYADPRNGKLYLVRDDAVYEFDSIRKTMVPFSWKSKTYVHSNPVNYGAVEIDFESMMTPEEIDQARDEYGAGLLENQDLLNNYDGAGEVDGDEINELDLGWNNFNHLNDVALQNSLSFTLFCGERAVYSRTFAKSGTYRLPAGLKSRDVAIGLSGAVKVRHIKIAETPLGLKEA